MKKIKLIFLNIIVIILATAFYAFAADVKSVPAPASPKAPPVAKPVAVQNPVPQPGKALGVPGIAPVPAAAPGKNTVQPAPAPVSAPVDNYTYNPAGKPDPFQPFVKPPEAAPVDGGKKIVKKIAPPSIFPLQRAETGQYRLVGIAGDKDYRVAVVEDAAKKFYPILIGTRIGLNEGKVVEIMADRVIVEEYENKKTKRITLKLRKN